MTLKFNHTLKSLVLTFILLVLGACNPLEQDNKMGTQETKIEEPLFNLLPSSTTQINFSNDVPQDRQINILTFEYLNNGGGVSIGDINNDGLPDIYFTGNLVPNRLYLNKGDFKFEDITKKANVGGSRTWTTGTTMIDINNDGYLDIYVCLSGQVPPDKRKNMLFINNGDQTFTENAEEYGLADEGFGNQAAFFDYDRDGDLDMFLLNHNVVPINRFNPFEIRQERDQNVGDKLYRNDNGNFVDVSREAGIQQNPLGYGLGVAIGDLNNDGWPDIYVSNDFLEPEYLYYNNGNGTFSQRVKEAMPHVSEFGMGNDIADFNNDGFLDVIVADMAAEDNFGKKTGMSSMSRDKFQAMIEDDFHYQYMYNTLQLNNGYGRFSEVAQLAGVATTDWSWAPLLFDMDNDGFKDLFVSNGYRKNQANKDYRDLEMERLQQIDNPGANNQQVQNLFMELVDSIPPRKKSNYVFHNNGDLTFSKKTKAWEMDRKSFSNGAAYGDLDNDGDMDLVVNNIDTAAFIYRNKASEMLNHNYLKIKLNGNAKNIDGLGSRIKLHHGEKVQMHEHYLTRGFESSVENTIHFGLASTSSIDSLTIKWPDGKFQKIENVAPNQVLTLNYQDAKQPENSNRNNQFLFNNYTASSGVSFKHQENNSGDYEKQPLLPHKMSQFGPAIAVGDVNQDGLEDFFVGGAKGQPATLYLQNNSQQFKAVNIDIFEQDKNYEDLDAAFFDADGDGNLDLYVVSGGYAMDQGDALLQDRLYINEGNSSGIPGFSQPEDVLPSMKTSGGVVSAEDFDNDGDTDLFIGGRVIPGKYPHPPRSYFLRNDHGNFTDITGEVAPSMDKPGMVTTAHWVDLNNDQHKDLVISGEWMPVKILLHNGQNGDNLRFRDVTSQTGLNDTEGWWFRIKSGDFDQDGDIDLIGGNLGLNYRYQATPEYPFHIYYNDFDGNGSRDIVLGYFNNGTLYPLQGRETIAEKMPFIEDKFPTYKSYGRATLKEAFGKEKLEEAFHLEAKTFASTYFENTGTNNNGIPQLTKKELPNYAQISAITGIITKDFNRDGHLDALTAGNLYGSEAGTPRNDAGIGLYLQGNGQGSLEAIHTSKSGFYAPGDVKNIKPVALGEDGETTLILVAKNDDHIQLIKVEHPKDPDI